MAESGEYIIDGDILNKMIDQFNFEAPQPTSQLHRMLPGQVFDTLEKKFIKTVADEIERSKGQTVRFVNLEALATGSHKYYLHAICASIVILIDSLLAKRITVTGAFQNPYVLPWNLVAKIDRDFKGIAAPGESAPP